MASILETKTTFVHDEAIAGCIDGLRNWIAHLRAGFQSSADTEARIRRAEEKIHRLEKLMQMTGLSW
jgi:hypothetical protein